MRSSSFFLLVAPLALFGCELIADVDHDKIGAGGSGAGPPIAGSPPQGGSGGTPVTGGNGGEGGTPVVGGAGGEGGMPSGGNGGTGGDGGTPVGGNGGTGGDGGSGGT